MQTKSQIRKIEFCASPSSRLPLPKPCKIRKIHSICSISSILRHPYLLLTPRFHQKQGKSTFSRKIWSEQEYQALQMHLRISISLMVNRSFSNQVVIQSLCRQEDASLALWALFLGIIKTFDQSPFSPRSERNEKFSFFSFFPHPLIVPPKLLPTMLKTEQTLKVPILCS